MFVNMWIIPRMFGNIFVLCGCFLAMLTYINFLYFLRVPKMELIQQFFLRLFCCSELTGLLYYQILRMKFKEGPIMSFFVHRLDGRFTCGTLIFICRLLILLPTFTMICCLALHTTVLRLYVLYVSEADKTGVLL
mgnify:CR=1 FL=1